MGEDAFPSQWGFYFPVLAVLPKMIPFSIFSRKFVEKLC
jgi:hypothetical protein